MQHLPASSLLLKIIHVRRGNSSSHNLQSSNGRHVSPRIVFYEKCQTLHTLEFDVDQVHCVRDFLKVASGECDRLRRVDIFDVL